MKTTEAKFNRRYKVGEYEHEDYTLTAILEGNDTGAEVLLALKADVTAAFSGEGSPAPLSESTPAAPISPPKKDKKNAKKDPEPVAEDDDETPADPEEDEAAEESEEEESEDEEEEEEEEDKTPPKKEKKTFKKKPQSYSRASEAHKEIFSNVLKAVAPDWKKSSDSKERAKITSQKMEGKEFLDESGEVLPEFKTEVKKLMSPKKK